MGNHLSARLRKKVIGIRSYTEFSEVLKVPNPGNGCRNSKGVLDPS